MSAPGSTGPVRVGLVGAGPWARLFTAPLLAAGPTCTLEAVWARRSDAAQDLAAHHGARAVADPDELFATCDAIAFAVPPDVQAPLAIRAARAGCAVLLEKPVAMTLAQAEELADTVGAAGVVSQVVLTNRYLPAMRDVLARAATFGAFGGRATFFGNGAIPGTFFATPWRVEHGALLDLGPHALDALDAALGPIVDVRASGHTLRMVAITCEHESGAVSQVTLSATTPIEPSGLVVELVGPGGGIVFDTSVGDPEARQAEFRAAMANITDELAAAVRTRAPHPLDVRRGLHLQRLLARVDAQLTRA